MLICNPKEAYIIYSQVRDKVIDYVANCQDFPVETQAYRDFYNSKFCMKFHYLGAGMFRHGFKVKNMVIKVPRNWSGARQNLVEYYTALANLPFTPKNTRLAMIKFQGYVIPVLIVPYQDTDVRNYTTAKDFWDEYMTDYNYTGDWAQFGKTTCGRYVLTDWSLVKHDVGRFTPKPACLADNY